MLELAEEAFDEIALAVEEWAEDDALFAVPFQSISRAVDRALDVYLEREGKDDKLRAHMDAEKNAARNDTTPPTSTPFSREKALAGNDEPARIKSIPGYLPRFMIIRFGDDEKGRVNHQPR